MIGASLWGRATSPGVGLEDQGVTQPALRRCWLTGAFAETLHLTASRPLQQWVPSDMAACRSEFDAYDVRREHLLPPRPVHRPPEPLP